MRNRYYITPQLLKGGLEFVNLLTLIFSNVFKNLTVCRIPNFVFRLLVAAEFRLLSTAILSLTIRFFSMKLNKTKVYKKLTDMIIFTNLIR